MFQQKASMHSGTNGRRDGMLFWLTLGLGWLACGAAADEDRTIPLEPGATYRAAALPARQQDLFRLPIEKAGLLTLDLSAPYVVTVEPAPELVATRPDSRIYWVNQPRQLEIAVASPIPGQPLGAYRLRSAFVAGTAPEMTALSPPLDPAYSCAMEPTSLGDPLSGSQGVVVAEAVDQWDCDVLEGQTLSAGILRLDSRLGSLQAILFGGELCSNETLLGSGTLSAVGQLLAPLFPGPFRVAVDAAAGFTGAYLLGAALFDPCGEGEQDDHHDSWLCATLLPPSTAVAGVVGNGHGDDVDQFTLVLDEPGTVEIDLAATAEGFRLRVVGASGQLLETAGGLHSWRAALSTGRYFLSLDRPDGSSAGYQLSWSLAP